MSIGNKITLKNSKKINGKNNENNMELWYKNN